MVKRRLIPRLVDSLRCANRDGIHQFLPATKDHNSFSTSWVYLKSPEKDRLVRVFPALVLKDFRRRVPVVLYRPVPLREQTMEVSRNLIPFKCCKQLPRHHLETVVPWLNMVEPPGEIKSSFAISPTTWENEKACEKPPLGMDTECLSKSLNPSSFLKGQQHCFSVKFQQLLKLLKSVQFKENRWTIPN